MIGCAKRGTITGGEKDITPPVLKYSSPENGNTGFKGKTIRLNFDEYIKLKDVQKQLVISPPLEKQPLITPTVASKYITIQLSDTLQPNTTYSFNFGNSIQDNNEGNILQQFKYIFSTGIYIDSLSLSGSIKDAFKKEPESFISVMLYEADENSNDSIVFKKNPRYITNTLDSLKTFKLENLKEGKYLLIAIKDQNSNHKFDPKQDKIGFIKEYITVPTETSYEIKLFQEELKFKAIRPSQASGNRIIMGYEGNHNDIKITLKNGNTVLPTIVTDFKGKDSVQIWYPAIKTDSLRLQVTKETYTADFTIKTKNQKKDTLNFNTNQQSSLNLRDQFSITSSIPLTQFEPAKMNLINKDSLAVPFTTKYEISSQKLTFDFTPEPLEKYTLTLLPGALTDYLEQKNDSLIYTFSTKNTSDYGNLKLTLLNVKSFPVIIELTNKKGDVLASAYSEGESVINFNNITPELYTIRIIYDENKNRVWDTGNYLEKRQPEKVIYFPKEVDVRANWDVDQPFSLSSD